jgi:hypothetical protein
LQNRKTGEKRTHVTKNIVTAAGDLHYAERLANVIPTDFTDVAGDFDGILELYAGAQSASPDKANDRSDLADLVADSGQAMDSGYPKLDDDDSDNSGAGAGVLTYRVSYATGDANSADIDNLAITNPSPAADEPLLMHAEFDTPFEKTSDDTLKVFINHTLAGV